MEKKEYWLDILINENFTLRDLDDLIRGVWVECCGHLSNFRIDGVKYEVSIDEDFFIFEKAETMDIALKDVLKRGQKISYEYDYGTPTDLEITVKAHKKGNTLDQFWVVGNNDDLKHKCTYCKKRKAIYIDPSTVYEESPKFICKRCFEELEDEEIDDIYWLNVCNTPRMGVCGFDGPMLNIK